MTTEQDINALIEKLTKGKISLSRGHLNPQPTAGGGLQALKRLMLQNATLLKEVEAAAAKVPDTVTPGIDANTLILAHLNSIVAGSTPDRYLNSVDEDNPEVPPIDNTDGDQTRLDLNRRHFGKGSVFFPSDEYVLVNNGAWIQANLAGLDDFTIEFWMTKLMNNIPGPGGSLVDPDLEDIAYLGLYDSTSLGGALNAFKGIFLVESSAQPGPNLPDGLTLLYGDGALGQISYQQIWPRHLWWYHLVVQKNGPDIRIFINGEPTAPATTATQNIATLDTLHIGHVPAFAPFVDSVGAPMGERFFSGWIDEVRISNVARYPVTGFTSPNYPWAKKAITYQTDDGIYIASGQYFQDLP